MNDCTYIDAHPDTYPHLLGVLTQARAWTDAHRPYGFTVDKPLNHDVGAFETRKRDFLTDLPIRKSR